jgi:hypothetical protein
MGGGWARNTKDRGAASPLRRSSPRLAKAICHTPKQLIDHLIGAPKTSTPRPWRTRFSQLLSDSFPVCARNRWPGRARSRARSRARVELRESALSVRIGRRSARVRVDSGARLIVLAWEGGAESRSVQLFVQLFVRLVTARKHGSFPIGSGVNPRAVPARSLVFLGWEGGSLWFSVFLFLVGWCSPYWETV